MFYLQSDIALLGTIARMLGMPMMNLHHREKLKRVRVASRIPI